MCVCKDLVEGINEESIDFNRIKQYINKYYILIFDILKYLHRHGLHEKYIGMGD